VQELVEFDVTAWPLVRVRLPSKLDVPAADSMFQGFDAVVARQAKFVTIIDTIALTTFPDAVARARIGEYMKARTFAEATFTTGNAVIMASAAVRATLTAINWIRRPLTPQYLVGNFPDALEWCCGRLAENGVALTPAIEVLRAQKRAGGGSNARR
jgi:hypothetical protein